MSSNDKYTDGSSQRDHQPAQRRSTDHDATVVSRITRALQLDVDPADHMDLDMTDREAIDALASQQYVLEDPVNNDAFIHAEDLAVPTEDGITIEAVEDCCESSQHRDGPAVR